jgi:hypothetical protein
MQAGCGAGLTHCPTMHRGDAAGRGGAELAQVGRQLLRDLPEGPEGCQGE